MLTNQSWSLPWTRNGSDFKGGATLRIYTTLLTLYIAHSFVSNMQNWETKCKTNWCKRINIIDCAVLNKSNNHKIQEAVNVWSINIVKVLWYSKSFVQAAVLEPELLLCPGFDCKNIIWKRMNVKHDTKTSSDEI